LAGLYHGALEAYAGKRGWLGMHRLKVYGFMELGFRGGRTQTNGGFHGTVEKLAWEGLDDTLEDARRERHSAGPPIGCPFARRRHVQAASDSEAASVKQVTLDVDGQGFVYEPGDRIGLLTQNSEELVRKTLGALQASGEELVPLNSVWREAMRQYPDEQLTQPAHISLTTFLACARIRPLLRPVGKALHALTRSPRLKAILEAREEDQWELWDTLQLLASENYDTRRLWKSEVWQAESIARLVPPQQFRVYSISSAPEAATAASLDLTVGPLTYESERSLRHGTASHFLTQDVSRAPSSMPAHLVRPSRFRLPVDRRRPIVMFGAGTGFAPFRGFLQARSQQAGCGEAHLFLGTTSPDRLPYREELERWVAAGQLNLHVAFSRAQICIEFCNGHLIEQPGPSGYVDRLMEQPENAGRLWELLRDRRDGGEEGYFYLCGQTRFAHTVIAALKKIIARFLPEASGSDDPRVQLYFRRLVAEGRLMCDIFTTFAPANAPGVLDYRLYETSEVVLHNNEAAGYWMIVQGNVYNVSEFRHLHPGGHRLLMANAGQDATRSYEKAEHHLSTEVHALLDLYKIGRIRRLDLKDVWGIALAPGPAGRVLPTATATQYGVIYLSLHDLYRQWVRYLFKIVDCENALANNFSLRRSALCGQSPATDLNRYKAGLLIDIHAMFESDYVATLTGDLLRYLWSATIGFCDNTDSVSRLGSLITGVEATPEAQHAHQLHADLVDEVAKVEGRREWRAIDDRFERMEQASAALLAAFKHAIRKGVQVFEALESETTRKGGPNLIEALCSLPQALSRYYASVR
jgi:sulfite reductase (NADPH) flavoprotein alpha-component